MHRQSVLRLVRQSGSLAQTELPPAYLAPSLHFTRARTPTQSSSFSSTAVAAGRDMNRWRGVSAIHHTGPKGPLGAQKYPLPKPVAPEKIERRNPTPNHGLWGFFPPDRQALSTPEYDISFGEWLGLDSWTHAHSLHIGRPWSIQELRERSWEDLHALWWVSARERNRIATSNLERERLNAGYGEYESIEREKTVRSDCPGMVDLSQHDANGIH